MRTALITILAGIGIVSSVAAAEQNPTISSMPRTGYYHSEEGYVQAVPWQTEQRASMTTQRRALVPDTDRQVRPRDPTTGKILQFRDESLSAPIFAE